MRKNFKVNKFTFNPEITVVRIANTTNGIIMWYHKPTDTKDKLTRKRGRLGK